MATGVVLLVIMASSGDRLALTFDRMPDGVHAPGRKETLQSPWLIILAMNLIMLASGMFIDLPAAVLLLTPVFVPLANAIGMDLTQLGIMMIVNLAIGLYHPPIGTTLFITSAIAKVRSRRRGARARSRSTSSRSACCWASPTCPGSIIR